MKRSIMMLVASGLTMFGFSGTALAGAILSAVGGTIQVGGPGFGTLTETFNQSGLNTPYTSGVTDFDTYLATEAGHTSVFNGFEWFSNNGTTTATVTYDLGGVFSIDAVALWNEEAAGIGTLALLGSTDNVTFSTLALGLSPTDWPTHPTTYFADRFDIAATSLRYIRFVATNCPQQPHDFNSCAIGEVAFRQASVPEPTTLALMGLGLAGIGYHRKRKAA